jgi:hypothetical protein
LWQHLSQSPEQTPEQRLLNQTIETIRRAGGQCSDFNKTVRIDGDGVTLEEKKESSIQRGGSPFSIAEAEFLILSKARFSSQETGVYAWASLKSITLDLASSLSKKEQVAIAETLVNGVYSYYASRPPKEVLTSIGKAVSQVCSNGGMQPLPNNPFPSSPQGSGLVTLGFFEQGGRIS